MADARREVVRRHAIDGRDVLGCSIRATLSGCLGLDLKECLGGARGVCANTAADVEIGEGHEEEGGEGGAEEGAVDGLEAGVWRGVDVEAGGAEELYGFVAGAVVEADGEDLGGVAVDAGAGAEVLEFVLFGHLLYAGSGGDVALVYQAVEELGGAFYHAEVRGYAEVSSVAGSSVCRPVVAQYLVLLVFFLLFLFLIVVVLRLHVQYHFQRLLVHGHLRLQAGKVEVVFDKVLGHLSEVLVAEQAAEGRYP